MYLQITLNFYALTHEWSYLPKFPSHNFIVLLLRFAVGFCDVCVIQRRFTDGMDLHASGMGGYYVAATTSLLFKKKLLERME